MTAEFHWDDARIFLAIARAGTLSGAADKMNMGIATVSRRLDRLEQALNVPLFSRHQSGYRLTDDGEACSRGRRRWNTLAWRSAKRRNCRGMSPGLSVWPPRITWPRILFCLPERAPGPLSRAAGGGAERCAAGEPAPSGCRSGDPHGQA